MLTDELLVDRFLRQHFRGKGVQVQYRYAKLHGGRKRQSAAVGQVVLGEVGDQRNAVIGSLKKGILGHVFIQKPVFHESTGQARQRHVSVAARHKCSEESLISG